jgi:hypothetical protein
VRVTPHGGGGENGDMHPGSCAGAAETGVGRAVSDAVREQGSRQRAWTARERVGRLGKKRARSGPREQCRLGFKTNFQNEHDLIRSKTGFILIKKIQIKYGCDGIKIRNNFPYWNFSKFGIEFELKFREGSRCLDFE